MIRTLDGAPINAIAADPEVRPWLGGTGPIDISAMVANPANYCFLTECGAGAYVVAKLQPGLYAVHTLAKRSARGRPMMRLMLDVGAMMFTQTDAIEITTLVPDGAELASRWADFAGFRETFRREAAFDLNGETVGASYRSMTYADWVLRDKRNAEQGAAFHDLLVSTRGHQSHPDDPVHDHWAGATALGCLAGNVSKAVGHYNRWASVAGYVQSTILSINPPVIDTGDAIIQIVNGRAEVLRTYAAGGSE